MKTTQKKKVSVSLRKKELSSYYDSVKDVVFVNKSIKIPKKLFLLIHENVHRFIHKVFKNKKLQLMWDIVCNPFNLKKIIKYYTSNPSIYFGGGETTTTSHTYYYYRIKFPHTSIDANQPIIFYDPYGEEVYTLAPNYEYMNYATGILSVPGNERNTDIENVASATYYVYYDSDDLIIDYENAEFKIKKDLIKTPAASKVTATFEYLTAMTAIKDIASVIDGKWDTQVQTTFTSEPPSGYNYAILDLGAIYEIQALDIVAGFFYPDEDHSRKIDIGMTISLRYSLDGVTYYTISDNTEAFEMSGGKSKKFEEDDLGVGFETRYFKLILESVDSVDYSSTKVVVSDANRDYFISQGLISEDTENGAIIIVDEGVWVVAFTEIAAYNNIVNKSEASLISTTYIITAIDLTGLSSGEHPTTIDVLSTEGFELASGETEKTAYILNSDNETFDSFTYTGTTATSFTGVSGLSESHTVRTSTSEIDGMVVQTIETDTTLYDYSGLLPKMGDRVYKVNKISNDYLYTKEQNDYLAKYYLKESYKNHTKINVNVMYAPHLQVGQTIEVIDPYNHTNRNYFIESITDNSGIYSLVLAYYP